jgi:hypothetical protein
MFCSVHGRRIRSDGYKAGHTPDVRLGVVEMLGPTSRYKGSFVHYSGRMAQSSFDTLRHFITSRMRMSHIYQPLMLKTMLERGGSASIRQIATAFLTEDESHIEYYEQIVKNMPGRVLAKHAIVERTGDRFRLNASRRHAVEARACEVGDPVPRGDREVQGGARSRHLGASAQNH